LIAEAKSLLKIPLVGNGDILTVDDALNMLKITKCDALMIGRGSVINPFIFHQIKAHYSGEVYMPNWELLDAYFIAYLAEIPSASSTKGKISKLKQLMSMLFKMNEELKLERQTMLTQPYENLEAFMHYAVTRIKLSNRTE
jgi:tRNA-dihydrouridine synthase C